MFVTFEGLDGSGKSTQAELLRSRLEADGPRGGLDARARRDGARRADPRPAPARRRRRRRGPRRRCTPPPARSTSRSVIRPALERGAAVICDRYVDSSVAYQGVARELGLDRVLELNLAAVGGLLPDRTFLLALDAAEIGAGSIASTTGSSARPTPSTRALPPATASSPRASRSGSSSSTARDPPTSSPRRCMEPFASVPEQPEAKRLLDRRARRTASRTRTSSTARPASASGRPRSRSRRRCSATRAASSAARIPTCTCSSRSAT